MSLVLFAAVKPPKLISTKQNITVIITTAALLYLQVLYAAANEYCLIISLAAICGNKVIMLKSIPSTDMSYGLEASFFINTAGTNCIAINIIPPEIPYPVRYLSPLCII